jgi:HK97 family phage portal protein
MLIQALQQNQENRSSTIVTDGGGFFNWFGGGAVTKKGTSVNRSSALTLSAFYNGITIICNDYAKLPKQVVKKLDGNTDAFPSHACDYLINERPNNYMNAFGFDSILLKCAILKGNGYAEIIRNNFNGQVESLEYIDESESPVLVKKFEGKLYYHFDNKIIESKNILHYRSLFSDNGITGIGIVTFAAKSLGVALSSQEFAEEYYSSKGIGTGVVTTSKEMKNEAKTRYGNALSKSLSSSNPFKVAVVDEAGSFQHIKLTPQESMFLETNKHAIGEVARWLNLPVFKLKITENQNNSNMENQSISHVSDSILPWAIINQQEYNAKLYTAAERKQGIRTDFDISSIMQADKKTEAEYYNKMISSGTMTRADVRKKLGLNKIAGLEQPLIPVNMQTQEQINKKLNSISNE